MLAFLNRLLQPIILAIKKEGNKVFKVKSAGRPKGSNKKLSPQQEKHIINMLVDKRPKEFKFKFALWTRESVKALIDREFDMDMPTSIVGHYLIRWQFASKKLIKRAYKRNDAKAKVWIKEEFPNFKEEAKREDAVI